MNESDSGRKDDGGKAPWHLFMWDAGLEVVRVLAFGATKYTPRNWERGIAYSRLHAAANRHLNDEWWQRGVNVDAESRCRTLGHAACCVLMLLAYELRGLASFDDRPGVAQ